MTELPDLSQLTHDEKDTLIWALGAQVQALTAQVETLAARVVELETKLAEPAKTPDNSSLPPSQGKKPNRPEKVPRRGPRPGSLGRMGGGRPSAETPDEIVSAKPVRCTHCQAALDEADHVLHGRYDKIDLPKAAPVVTRESCGPRPPTARSPAGSAPLGALTCSQACAPSSAPPLAAASAPTRLSSKPCGGRPPPTRVEQKPFMLVAKSGLH